MVSSALETESSARGSPIEESLLVNLLGMIGMPNENNFHAAITPRQKYIEQHVESLREIFHMLRHRTRYVHKAEHHRLRHGPRFFFVSAIADVDRIDKRDALGSRLQGLDFSLERDTTLVIAIRGRGFGLELFDRFGALGRRRATLRAIASRTVLLTEIFAGDPVRA